MLVQTFTDAYSFFSNSDAVHQMKGTQFKWNILQNMKYIPKKNPS